MAENYVLQLLRSGVDYSDYNVALGALEGKLKGETLKDGELASASYKATIGSGEEATVVTRTLLGIKRTADGSNVKGGASVFIDVEETRNEIDAAIAKLLGTGSGGNDGLTLKSLDTAIKAEADRAKAAEEANTTAIETEVNRAKGAEKDLDEKIDALAITPGDGIAVDDNNGLKVSVEVDGTSIIVGTDNKLKVVDSALTQYSGAEAINVENAEEGNNKVIKLKLDADNKILSQGVNGLKATLSLAYNEADKKIELKAGEGEDAEVVTSLDATKFIADGMLDKVAFSEETGKENYLVFTFNADGKKTPIEINLGKYITTYTAGNGINLGEDERTISVDIKSGDNYIGIDENGKVASKGIDEKIATEIGELNAEKSSPDGKVKVTVKEVAGKITEVAVATNDIASAQDLSNEIARATEAEETNAADIATNTAAIATNTTAIETEVNRAKGAEKENADAIDALEEKVDAMSLQKTGGDGKYIKSVTQTDGKVTVEIEDLKAGKVASEAVTITVDGAGSKTVLESGTVQEALAAIATRLTAVEENRIIDCGTY